MGENPYQIPPAVFLRSNTRIRSKYFSAWKAAAVIAPVSMVSSSTNHPFNHFVFHNATGTVQIPSRSTTTIVKGGPLRPRGKAHWHNPRIGEGNRHTRSTSPNNRHRSDRPLFIAFHRSWDMRFRSLANMSKTQ